MTQNAGAPGPAVGQIDTDRTRAGANRRHYEQLLRLAALSRRGRLTAARVTASERAALDMVWRQRQRYRRLELFLERAGAGSADDR